MLSDTTSIGNTCWTNAFYMQLLLIPSEKIGEELCWRYMKFSQQDNSADAITASYIQLDKKLKFSCQTTSQTWAY